MKKPHIVIVDEDKTFVFSLAAKFISDLYEKIDLELITDHDYYNAYFSQPRKIDILLISESLYSEKMSNQDINTIFVLAENDVITGNNSANYISKYSSPASIFNEVMAKTLQMFNLRTNARQTSKVIVVTSASGGTGKTTISFGVASSLTKKGRRVLYLDAEMLQTFQHLMTNKTPIIKNDIYSLIKQQPASIYKNLQQSIRTEIFNYLPPFKMGLKSMNMDDSVFLNMIDQAKKSKDYDYIIVDTDHCFDERKTKLLNIADMVVVVVNPTFHSLLSANTLFSNLENTNTDKYVCVCNRATDPTEDLDDRYHIAYNINENVEEFKNYTQLSNNKFSSSPGIQKVAILVE